MKKLLCFVVPALAACLLALSGCGLEQHPAYSSGVVYGVRTDPIIREGQGPKLGDPRHEPDRPGVLPIMHFPQILEAGHPYQPKIREKLGDSLDEMIKTSGKDATKLPPAERLTLQDKFMREPKNRTPFDRILDTILRDPAKITDKDRSDLESALLAHFGTPANPKVKINDHKDLFNDKDLELIDGGDEDDIKKVETKAKKALTEFDDAVKELRLDDKTLEEGSTRYRVHCLHCHGVPGDGRGPTARWINPHPRDFRGGIFKFQSINQLKSINRPPSCADLTRTLRQGIEGTAMPSFALLTDRELDSLVSYVIHLSIRGRVEADVINKYFDLNKETGALEWSRGPKSETPMTHARALALSTNLFMKAWRESAQSSNAIDVAAYPYQDGDVEQLKASVQRGFLLFTGNSEKHPRGKSADCKSCHDDFGRRAQFKFDDWGTLTRPNNFQNGIFRGGRRPVDLYYRIHSGINGSGMNNFGAVLQGQDIWDLVNFVSTLSYPAMQKSLGVMID